MPAPALVSAARFSMILTGIECLLRHKAAVNPAMPAPIIVTFFLADAAKSYAASSV